MFMLSVNVMKHSAGLVYFTVVVDRKLFILDAERITMEDRMHVLLS